MAKPLSIASIKKKRFTTFPFYGDYRRVFDEPERNGFWLIYGREKHGKTWFSLMLADYLSKFEKVLYISAEEGFSKAFVDAVERAKIQSDNKKLTMIDYVSLDYVEERLERRAAPKVIFFDNITVMQDDLKNGQLKKLFLKYKDKALFVFIAHQDDQQPEPYTATAKMVKKLAKVIVRIEGLTGFVSGRCPGGVLMIDEEKAMLYHGTHITTLNSTKQ